MFKATSYLILAFCIVLGSSLKLDHQKLETSYQHSAAYLENATSSGQINTFLNQNGGFAVVFVTTSWCSPCKKILPYVKKQSS